MCQFWTLHIWNHTVSILFHLSIETSKLTRGQSCLTLFFFFFVNKFVLAMTVLVHNMATFSTTNHLFPPEPEILWTVKSKGYVICPFRKKVYPRLSKSSRLITWWLILVLPTILLLNSIPSYAYMCAKSLQSCLTLCNPVDCRLSGTSFHGILQERMFNWPAMPSSRRSSWPRDWTRGSYVSYLGR